MEFSQTRWKVISDISRDIALAFFISVFLGPLLSNESANPIATAAGLIVAVVLWGASIAAVK